MRAPESVDDEFAMELEDALLDVLEDLAPSCDLAEVVWLPRGDGGMQPVLWPMTLHTHGQECLRA